MTELGKLYVLQRDASFFVDIRNENEIEYASAFYNAGDTCMLLSVEVDNGPWHKPGEPDELCLTCLGYDGTVFCTWQDAGAGQPLYSYAVPLEEAT